MTLFYSGLNDDLPLHRHGKDNTVMKNSKKDDIKMCESEKDQIRMRHSDNEPASYVLQSGCYLWPGR